MIEGKVAQLLNTRELAINIGSQHGVKRGMRFAILAATALEVRDPETQEVLDVIDREKVRVEAVEVRERITICSTYETKTVGSFSSISAITEMMLPQRTIVKSLKASDESYPRPLSPEDSYVKVGDRVRQLVELEKR